MITDAQSLELIAEVLEKDLDELSGDKSLEANEWDSLASVTLLATIDERFAGTVAPDEIDLQRSLADFAKLLQERLSTKV